jgi:hypothetical protein
LEDESGEQYVVPQQALADLFRAYSPPLNCVILNACFSISQGQLASVGVPFTIAMEGLISDDAAIEFSRGFYDAIGAGKDIEFAYEEGRRTVQLAAPNTQFISIMLSATAKTSVQDDLVAKSRTTGPAKLDWQGLVNQIKEKGNEDPEGKFMVTNKNWIVSDPDLLRGIFEARKGDYPFMMIGSWGTGKNIVLELINRGTKRRNYEFQDLNLNLPENQLHEEYFGTKHRPGVIERHDGALIHLDVMEDLHDKAHIVDKILTLIEKGQLLRSDGTIARIDVRIIGGMKIDPDSSLRSKSTSSQGISLLLVLVDRLATNLIIRTKRIAEMPDRIPTLITEQFATLYLNGKFTSDELNKVALVPQEIIRAFQEHEWIIDKDFYELTQIIQRATHNGNWENAF